MGEGGIWLDGDTKAKVLLKILRGINLFALITCYLLKHLLRKILCHIFCCDNGATGREGRLVGLSAF